MNYEVEGIFSVSVKLHVNADNETDAIELAKNNLKDYYRLDVHGASHNPNTDVIFKIEAFEDDNDV